MYNIHILGPRDKIPEKSVVINTTSRSTDFGKTFSPMICQGPLELSGLTSYNVENFWQATKVYLEHSNNPKEWLKWRDALLSDRFARRYPMGKGRAPEFSYLDAENGRMSYIQARRVIYVPIYMQKLEKYCSRAVNSVVDMLTVTDVSFWDFDGRVTEESFDEILNNQHSKCGHAFVLKKYIYNILGKRF
jgi:hypothetical protein